MTRAEAPPPPTPAPTLTQRWSDMWTKRTHSRQEDMADLCFAYWHCHCDGLVALYCLICHLVPANYETLMLFMLSAKQQNPNWNKLCTNRDVMAPFCEGDISQQQLLAAYQVPNPVLFKLMPNFWPGSVTPPPSLKWFYQRWWWLSPYVSFFHAPLTEGPVMLLLIALMSLHALVPQWWRIGGRTLAIAGIRFWSLGMFARKSGATYLTCRQPFLLGLEHILARSVLFSVPDRHANIVTAIESALLLLLSCLPQSLHHGASVGWVLQVALGMAMGAVIATHFNKMKIKVLSGKLCKDEDMLSGKLRYDVGAALQQLSGCVVMVLSAAVKQLWTVNGVQGLILFVAYLILTAPYINQGKMPPWLQILTV